MRELRVGISPCPNDTAIFHGLFSGRIDVPGVRLTPLFDDVEALNRLARDRRLDVTKVSFHAYAYLREHYRLLSAGAALGRGCGPLVLTRPESAGLRLSEGRVAIPGHWTSAALLLRLYDPEIPTKQLVEVSFERIPRAVAAGDVEAGVIIHESRFTYGRLGLVPRVDLGDWWEETQGLPIPLGGIIADRRLGNDLVETFDRALRESVVLARSRPEESRDFVRQHAQELSDDVIRAHIDLYVNDFTVDLGEEGRRAVHHLLRVAEERGVLDLGGI